MSSVRSRWPGLGPLTAGDRMAVVSPAGPTPAASVERAAELLSDWCLRPVVYPSAAARHTRADYLSGSDEQRAADLTHAWCDPTIAGIFCLRGGYGCVRTLDLLDLDRMRSVPAKPLYGSSDVTALHEWLWERLGTASWFTPGTIALIEDVHEETYRLDGYLVSLLRAGWFDGVVGIALGSWLDCGSEDEIIDLCMELLGPLGVPMVSGLGFGHAPGAPSIPLGCRALLMAERGSAELVMADPPATQELVSA